MPKSMTFLLQKSVKAAFLSRVHKFDVQFFCTSTDCTNGVQKSGLHCAKNCSMMKTQKRFWYEDLQKYEEFNTKEVNNL